MSQQIEQKFKKDQQTLFIKTQMSLFKKSNSLKEKPVPDKTQDHQAILAQTQLQISTIDTIIEQTESQAQILDDEIRRLAQDKKKIQAARSKLIGIYFSKIELKQLQKKIIGLDQRRSVLFQLQVQIETNTIDLNVVSVLENGTQLMKDSDLVDKLNDVVLDFQEIQQKQSETDNLFSMMASQNQDTDEIDNLLNEYIQQDQKIQATYQVPDERVPQQIIQTQTQQIQQKQVPKQQVQYN